MEIWLVAFIPSLFCGILLWYIARKFRLQDKKAESREAARIQNNVLLLKGVSASLSLGDATANNIALGSNFSVGAYLNRIRIIGGAATDSTLAAQNTMTAVAASSTAMAAVAASSTARSAIRVSTTAITAINASQLALDAMYAAATKFTNTHGGWSAMPATLAGTGNYLIVRLTQVQTGFTIGATVGQYLRRGDASTWTMTDGDSTANIPTRSAGTRRDNALRTVNNMSIQYYLWEAFEIAYLTA